MNSSSRTPRYTVRPSAVFDWSIAAAVDMLPKGATDMRSTTTAIAHGVTPVGLVEALAVARLHPRLNVAPVGATTHASPVSLAARR